MVTIGLKLLPASISLGATVCLTHCQFLQKYKHAAMLAPVSHDLFRFLIMNTEHGRIPSATREPQLVWWRFNRG